MKKKFITLIMIIVLALSFTVSTVQAQNFKRPSKNNFSKVSIPVLMYHSIKDKPKNEYELEIQKFKKQIKYLDNMGYTSLSIDDYYKIINGELRSPCKSVLITFDDGAIDNYTNAYPILKKYNLKATFFIVANWVNTENYMTSDQIKELSNSDMDIECHGLNHEWFSTYGYNDQYNIIAEARDKISKITSKEVNYFAFPYGDIDENCMTCLYNMGFKMGFSSIGGLSSNDDNRFCLKRQYISGNDSLADFISKLFI